MRSRALRLTFGAAALLAIGAAAFLLIRSERQIRLVAASVRALDQHAREATDALTDLRVAQQAYVAAGQGAPFWMAKVSSTTEAATATLAALRETGGAGTHAALDEATATTAAFPSIDQRVR